jgi:hypothetical protein
VADAFENEIIGPFEDMLVLGEGWRVATEYAKGGDPQAKKAANDLGGRITAISSMIQSRSKFEPVPLKRAAAIQLRALLILMGWRLGQGVSARGHPPSSLRPCRAISSTSPSSTSSPKPGRSSG